MTTLKEGSPTLNPASDYLRGRAVKTSPIPAKHPYFAAIKSNNYLPNVLATLDAESENKDYVRNFLSPLACKLLQLCYHTKSSFLTSLNAYAYFLNTAENMTHYAYIL